MVIKVKYTAQLKKTTGTAEEIITVPENISLDETLHILSAHYKDNFHKMIFNEDNEFSNSIVPVVNGRQIRMEDNILLKDGDELLLLSPIAGG